MITRLVEAGQDGRLLIVNTSNVDNGDMRAWDVVAEAQRGLTTGDVDRVHRILLASSGIPGAFPFREIDGEMYVDGGITGNILYGGRLGEKETFAAVWATRYPDIPMPLTRYWVIFNNQLLPPPQVTAPNWPAVVSRSLEMSTRAATVTALRHLYSMSEIARLKHGVTIEIRVAAIPGDWVPPEAGGVQREDDEHPCRPRRAHGGGPGHLAAGPTVTPASPSRPAHGRGDATRPWAGKQCAPLLTASVCV